VNDIVLGFVGLGNMGGPMSARLAEAGFDLLVFDAAGSADKAPNGAQVAGSVAEVAARAPAVLLSLPDGATVQSVVDEMVAVTPRAVTMVVDFSTVGIEPARAVAECLSGAGIGYVDAPVSGGTAGAAAGTLAIMAAGASSSLDELDGVFANVGRLFRVGEQAGQGQAMKLLNNFLSATAMAATSEAVSFGERHGLERETMISVLNASTGQNTATSDKFPRRILTGAFDSGFATRLMTKDLELYCESVAAAGSHGTIGAAVTETWRGCFAALPDSDFTRVYEYVRDHPLGD
jgi:3-hydroxyisobutyrate dehydrogenase